LIKNIPFLLRYHLFHKHRINKTREEKVLGEKFLVLPGVFSPKSYRSSKVFADFVCGLDGLSGKRVLDMGCGTGIIGIFAAKKGANVLAADINPVSVQCAARNAEVFFPSQTSTGDVPGLNRRIRVIQSDLFENLEREKFDIIFFNPPYYDREPSSDFEIGFYGGKNFRVIRRFALDASNHLKPDACIYLIVSSDVSWVTIRNIFIENGFEHNLVLTKKKFFEEFLVFKFRNQI